MLNTNTKRIQKSLKFVLLMTLIYTVEEIPKLPAKMTFSSMLS